MKGTSPLTLQKEKILQAEGIQNENSEPLACS